MKVTREAHVAACTWEQRDKDRETLHSVTETENRETQGPSTTPWQSIPENFLGVSSPSCGELPHWRWTSDYAVAEYYTAVE